MIRNCPICGSVCRPIRSVANAKNEGGVYIACNSCTYRSKMEKGQSEAEKTHNRLCVAVDKGKDADAAIRRELERVAEKIMAESNAILRNTEHAIQHIEEGKMFTAGRLTERIGTTANALFEYGMRIREGETE